MRIGIVFIIVFFATTILNAQNYFTEYPINVSIASNGSQNRLECSTFDSSLQTMVYYQTDWYNGTILVSSNAFGKVGFTSWSTPVNQNPFVGFVMYDHSIHAFTNQVVPVSLTNNKKANVVCGRIWITVAVEFPQTGFFYYEYEHYRYNLHLHVWVKCDDIWYENLSNIWNLPAKGNTDVVYEEENETHRYYDPVSNEVHETEEVCNNNGELFNDDYIAILLGCNPDYSFLVYDAETHIYEKYPRLNLSGTQNSGIFWATDDTFNDKKFFFTYDQAIHQWVTDSVESPNVTDVINQDRIIAYIDSTAGYSKKVFYMAYHAVQHAWLKDSTAISGNATNLVIQDGTVKWSDLNGLNIRGYVEGSGWGNNNTVPFLYFHLTDFTSQGHPMVHVRNYSIGVDSVYYDFGDGVTSLDNRHVMWHSYTTTGIYNICLYNTLGTQSNCQQLTMNICSSAGQLAFSNDTICAGDSLHLSLSTYSGSIQWQKESGNVWVNESGTGATDPVYGLVPTQTSTYRASVTNGSCIPAYSGEKTIKVYEEIGNPYLSDSLLTKCSNGSVKIVVLNSNINATYRWQQDNGIGWTNIFNATNNYYNTNATVNTQYRCIITSGLCFADTTDINSVTIEASPAVPVATPGYSCGPGYANLYAAGSGNMHWYRASPMDSILYIGNFFSPYITASTGFKVKASSGTMTTAGYANSSIGTSAVLSNEKKGIRFYNAFPGTLEHFSIYPLQSGTVHINLYNTTNNEVVESIYEQVSAGTVKIWINTYLHGNMTYDLVVMPGSVPLEVNTTGMNYPITISGSPMTITGYVDTLFHNSSGHYNFYDITISTGCKSASSATVMATFVSAFNIASITPSGPTTFCQGDSVILSAINNPNYGYLWLRNGSIAATSGSSFTAYESGNYVVIMNNNVPCYDTSLAVKVTVPCVQQSDPVEKNEIENNGTENLNVFYNSFTDEIIIHLPALLADSYFFTLIDQSGRILIEQKLLPDTKTGTGSVNLEEIASGIYIVKIQSERKRFTKKLFKS